MFFDEEYDWDEIVRENDEKIAWDEIVKNDTTFVDFNEKIDFQSIEETQKNSLSKKSHDIDEDIINEDSENEQIKLDKNCINFFKNNKFTILLIIMSIILIIINKHDKINSSTIVVNVSEDIRNNDKIKIEKEKEIYVFVYNKDTSMLEKIIDYVPESKRMIEGDYINKIIEHTDYIDDGMKFQSAYLINENNRKVLKIILNSNFKQLKNDEKLFNGFREAVFRNILEYYPDIKEVKLEID